MTWLHQKYLFARGKRIEREGVLAKYQTCDLSDSSSYLSQQDRNYQLHDYTD